MINAYCVDDLVISRWNGNDDWGEPLSGTLVCIKGYVEWKTKLVRNINGEEVVSTVTIFIPKKLNRPAYLGRALCHEDRIVEVNGETLNRAIIAIGRPGDFSFSHYEVNLA